MSNKNTVFSTFTMVLLLLSPILAIYGKPDGWSYGEIMVIPISALFFMYNLITQRGFIGDKDPLPNGMLLYFIYWGFMIFLTSFIIPLSALQSFLIFFLFFSTFHKDSFIRMYKIFSMFCILFFFAQEFSYYVLGHRISGLISSLPLHIGMDMVDLVDFQANSVRSCSLFSEPAHFAQFLLPLFAIELFYDKERRHFLFAIIIGLTLLLLQSGNGLFGLIVVLLSAVLYFRKIKKRNAFFMFLLYVAIVLVAGFYFINSEMGNSMLGRQEELSINYEGGSMSGFLRVWRGYYVFSDYSFYEKIFGCPDITTQIAHIRSTGLLIGTSAELYFNAFQKILLNTGFIGVIMFVFIVVNLWRNNSFCGRVILFTFVVLSFIAAIYMSNTMILFFVLSKSMKDENQKPYNQIIIVK